MSALPNIHAIWIGEKLSEVAVCCLTSFVMRGHSVYLHTYNNIINKPKGIDTLDANQLIHHSKIFRHKTTGSYAVFADLLRYELLKQYDGIYVDCDVYCLKPFLIPESGYLMGYEDENYINNAILALPKDSLLLQKLSDIRSNFPYFVPPWLSPRKQMRLKIKHFFNKGETIDEMTWGTTGPLALTHFVQTLQLAHLVQAVDTFYPITPSCIGPLMTKITDIRDLITEQTIGIHLYNEALNRYVQTHPMKPNAILEQMLTNTL